jgi:predicted nucleic acid-binding protein
VTVLAATSVWVDDLRLGPEGRGAHLDDLLAGGQVVVCGPVVAEILAGAPDAHRSELRRRFQGLPWSELHRADWARVGEIAAGLRSRGTPIAYLSADAVSHLRRLAGSVVIDDVSADQRSLDRA